MKNLIFIFIVISVFAVLTSCEDDVPNDYEPETFVEGLMIVDEPIKNVILMKSQPIQDTFRFMESLIPDAEVYVRYDDKEIKLTFSNDPDRPGYYNEDTDYLVEPNKTYELEIKLKDSEDLITGTTTTPGRIQWVIPPKPVIQYPIDSLNPGNPDSLVYSWSATDVPSGWYIIRTRCNDTLEYGKYLDPPTEEMNRRFYKPFESTRGYNDKTFFTFIQNNKTNFVWTWFKWYGKSDIKVYAPDDNYLIWFLQYQRSSQILQGTSSVEGALGLWGSASAIIDSTFILKNQP
jgi:hypothetical protein